MCGIFALINNNNDADVTSAEFKKGEKRGPEFSVIKQFANVTFGFHRLAINGLNNTSNQPIISNDIILICNGEIYNYKSLIQDHDIVMQTQSDCEVIIHMYKLYGIKYTLNLLDGEFAFIIYDKRTNTIIAARDSYGVRPLYYFYENNSFGFASELKVLYNLVSTKSIDWKQAFIKPFLICLITLVEFLYFENLSVIKFTTLLSSFPSIISNLKLIS